jgi:hypothetical protein
MYFVEWGMTKKIAKPAGAFNSLTVKTRKQTIQLARGLVWGTFDDPRSSKNEKLEHISGRILAGGESNRRIVIFNEDETRWVAVTRDDGRRDGPFSGTREAMHGPSH